MRPKSQRMTFWTSDEEPGTEDLAAWLASIGSSTGTDGGATFDPGDYQDGYGYGPPVTTTPTEPVFDVGDEEVPRLGRSGPVVRTRGGRRVSRRPPLIRRGPPEPALA